MTRTRVLAVVVTGAASSINENAAGFDWMPVAVVALAFMTIVVMILTSKIIGDATKVSASLLTLAQDSQKTTESMIKMTEVALQAQATTRMEIMILERKLTPDQLEEAREVVKDITSRMEVKIAT